MLEFLRFLVEELSITGFLIVASLVFLMWQKSRTGRALGVLLLFLATPITGNTALQMMDRGVNVGDILSSKDGHDIGDIVIALGGGTYFDHNDRAWPTRISVLRASKALEIAKSQNIPLLFTGGVAAKGAANEAETLLEMFENRLAGVETIIEPRSVNTADNARESTRIASELNAKRLLVVTSAVHSIRASLAFQRYSSFQTTVVTVQKVPEFSIIDLVPREQGLWKWRAVFHEFIGILWYAWRGWI